jgi:pyruvate dehydrogenase E1 component alpha subunit
LTYRTIEEEASWRARDPLKQFRERVLPEGLIAADELDRLDQEAEDLMEEAVRFADASPMPELTEIYEDVYVDYPLDMMRRGINM